MSEDAYNEALAAANAGQVARNTALHNKFPLGSDTAGLAENLAHRRCWWIVRWPMSPFRSVSSPMCDRHSHDYAKGWRVIRHVASTSPV